MAAEVIAGILDLREELPGHGIDAGAGTILGHLGGELNRNDRNDPASLPALRRGIIGWLDDHSDFCCT